MSEPALQLPFARIARQREADRLGMLIFLATEVMLFGGVFAGALTVRLLHPGEYVHASQQMHYWLGGINTAVLLTSSLLVALAVSAVRDGRARLSGWLLGGAIGFALAFLVIKFTEYAIEWNDGVVPVYSPAHLAGSVHELVMTVYFIGTGLHALHVTVGTILLGTMIWPLGAARSDTGATTVGNAALYWHFVDIVWIFLYPTLYLAR
ncbi:cytochrome c oxidase subunit 3 [Novosphingobium sp. PY1]|uniref:cytochrome c oxidase subunit 3 n=1 Tax=Novosphingobium sp. PY1 TaxID=1882221 RepID=UPI001A8CFBED|nr:cytochrome c oxidase subunit 3 [Novosphingobium sp. PY1]GFM30704.1 cytochrome B561 [Novosphingobium sp. PY1]